MSIKYIGVALVLTCSYPFICGNYGFGPYVSIIKAGCIYKSKINIYEYYKEISTPIYAKNGDTAWLYYYNSSNFTFPKYSMLCVFIGSNSKYCHFNILSAKEHEIISGNTPHSRFKYMNLKEKQFSKFNRDEVKLVLGVDLLWLYDVLYPESNRMLLSCIDKRVRLR